MRVKMPHIHSTKNQNVLLYVVKESVMIPCQMFAALMYTEKWNEAHLTRPYRVKLNLSTEKMALDFRTTQYGLVWNPSSTQRKPGTVL